MLEANADVLGEPFRYPWSEALVITRGVGRAGRSVGMIGRAKGAVPGEKVEGGGSVWTSGPVGNAASEGKCRRLAPLCAKEPGRRSRRYLPPRLFLDGDAFTSGPRPQEQRGAVGSSIRWAPHAVWHVPSTPLSRGWKAVPSERASTATASHHHTEHPEPKQGRSGRLGDLHDLNTSQHRSVVVIGGTS